MIPRSCHSGSSAVWGRDPKEGVVQLPQSSPYEPPRLTRVGSLHELLLVPANGLAIGKSGPTPDGASGLSGNRGIGNPNPSNS